jgi:hypothetical protein
LRLIVLNLLISSRPPLRSSCRLTSLACTVGRSTSIDPQRVQQMLFSSGLSNLSVNPAW